MVQKSWELFVKHVLIPQGCGEEEIQNCKFIYFSGLSAYDVYVARCLRTVTSRKVFNELLDVERKQIAAFFEDARLRAITIVPPK